MDERLPQGATSPLLESKIAGLLSGALICALSGFALLQNGPDTPIFSSVWPASGFAIGVLWLFGYRLLPAVALGVALAALGAGQGVVAALSLAAIQALEATLAVYLLRRFIPRLTPLSRTRDVWVLAAVIGLIAAPLSAALGTGALVLSGALQGDFLQVWFAWWVAHLTGGILIAPLVVAVYRALRQGRTALQWLELLLFAMAMGLLGWLAFDPRVTAALGQQVWLASGAQQGLDILPVPILLWATLRYRQLGASVSMLALGAALVAVHMTVFRETGIREAAPILPWAGATLTMAQLYLSVLCVMALVVAALLSERMRVESSLRQQQRQLTTLLGNLPGMAYRCANDAQWHMEFISAGCELLSGYAPRDFEQGRVSWAELIHPADRQAVREEVARATTCGDIFEMRYRIRTRSGEEKWVWERGTAVPGDTILLEGLIADVTQLKAYESALARSEAQGRAVMATAAEAIVLIDTGGLIRSFNRAAETMFGYSAEAVFGKNVKLLMPEPYRAQHDGYLQHYKNTGERKIIGIGREVVGRRADGSEFPMELAVSEVEVEGQKSFTGIIRDISERKEAEEELRRSHEQLEATFQNAPIGIVTFRFGQSILSANRAFCDLVGYSEDELRSMTLDQLTHPRDRALMDQLAEAALSGELEYYSYEKRYVRRTGEVAYVKVRNALTHDREGRTDLVIGQVEDLTGRRNAEREATEQRERLAHVSRLSTLGEMAAGIAHEINQPLTAISLYAQSCQRLLRMRDVKRAKVTDALEKLSQQSLRAGAIIERLQRLVRYGESQKELTDCNQLVHEIATLVASEMRMHTIDVKLELAEGLPEILCDPVQIQQVILNFLRNGMQAMSEPMVNQPSESAGPGTLRVRTALSDEDTLVVSVIDAGPGVPEAMAKSLFEPFSTDKDSGMGMGLAICRSIIETHGGELGFRNNPDQGATFFFRLPRGDKEFL